MQRSLLAMTTTSPCIIPFTGFPLTKESPQTSPVLCGNDGALARRLGECPFTGFPLTQASLPKNRREPHRVPLVGLCGNDEGLKPLVQSARCGARRCGARTLNKRLVPLAARGRARIFGRPVLKKVRVLYTIQHLVHPRQRVRQRTFLRAIYRRHA